MRFLFTLHPATGHLNPLLPVALALQDAGHVVRLATAPSFIGDIERAGLRGVSAGRDWLESEAATTMPGFLEGGLPHQVKTFASLAHEFLDDLLAQDLRPDLVVRESAEYSGAVYAACVEVPCVTHGITVRPPLALLEHWAGEPLRALVRRAGGGETLEIFERGILLNHMPRSWVPPEVELLPGDRFFAPAEAAPGADRDPPGWIEQRDPSRPLVYATLGTVFNAAHVVFEKLVAAADRQCFDLLLTVGRNGRPSDFETPDNVHVERFVDQDLILGEVAAVVCHGGMGTVMGALRRGVPVCCIPLSADQPVNALRCHALGCGRSYTTYTPTHGVPLPHARPADLEVDLLREHIVALLEETTYRAAAARLAAEIESLPGVAAEAELLSQLAASS
jgi:UDP:flavonoid glycosyltransferase YjiC (YdhE family)